jgi:hypothetical protein
LKFVEDTCGNLTDIRPFIDTNKTGVRIYFDTLDVTRKLGPKTCYFSLSVRVPSTVSFAFALSGVKTDGKIELRPNYDWARNTPSSASTDLTVSSQSITNFTTTSISSPFQGVLNADFASEVTIGQRDLTNAEHWWSTCGMRESRLDFIAHLQVYSGRGYMRLRYVDLQIKWKECEVS